MGRYGDGGVLFIFLSSVLLKVRRRESQLIVFVSVADFHDSKEVS